MRKKHFGEQIWRRNYDKLSDFLFKEIRHTKFSACFEKLDFIFQIFMYFLSKPSSFFKWEVWNSSRLEESRLRLRV